MAAEENSLRGAGAKPLRAIIGNFLTKILIYPLAFASSVVVDRTLGAHEKGVFAFLLLVGSFVLPLLTFGFGAAVIYYVSAGKQRVADIGLTSLLVGFLQGLLCSLLMGAAWRLGLLGSTGAEAEAVDVLPILAIAPLQGIQLMANRLLFGESKFGVSNWLDLGRSLLSPVLLFGLVVVADRGLRGAVLATVILNVAITIAMVAALSPRRFKLRYDGPFVREGLRYGIKIWVGDLATRANLRLDQLLLGIFAPASSLGNYAVAVALSEVLWIGVDAVSPVLFNRLAAAKNVTARVELTGRVHRLGFAAMVALGVVAGVVGWFAIPLLFGSQFREAPFLFELLLPGVVALFTAKILTKYFAAEGRPELSGRVGLVSGLLGALLYFALIPLGATTGAAIASSLSYATMSVVSFVLYRRAIKPQPARLVGFDRTDVVWARAFIKTRGR